jgi:hypothetical protein
MRADDCFSPNTTGADKIARETFTSQASGVSTGGDWCFDVFRLAHSSFLLADGRRQPSRPGKDDGDGGPPLPPQVEIVDWGFLSFNIVLSGMAAPCWGLCRWRRRPRCRGLGWCLVVACRQGTSRDARATLLVLAVQNMRPPTIFGSEHPPKRAGRPVPHHFYVLRRPKPTPKPL